MFQIKKWQFFIIAATLFVPLMLWRDFTPDNELRYLSIADEALRNSSVFTFSNHGVPYADKPPLYIWLLMLCRRLFGCWTMWALCLLSLIPALVTAGIMERWTRGQLSRKYQLATMAMLLTTGLFLGATIFVRMDMLMTMFIVLAVWTFWRQYTKGFEDNKSKNKEASPSIKKTRLASSNYKVSTFIFPVWLFLALFTKGPLGVLIPLAGITLFLFVKKDMRRWTEFFGFKTWAVLGGLCALWFLGVYIEGGAGYLNNLLFHQTMDRAVNAFHHKRPVWYYVIAAAYSLAPWTLLVVGVMFASLKKKLIQSDMEKLFLCMSAATFVLLTCISSKLAIYLLPMLPFALYYVMLRIKDFDNSLWARLCVAFPAFIFAEALPALLVITRMEAHSCYRQQGFIAAAAALSVAGIAACLMLTKIKQLHNAMLTMACGVGFAAFAGGFSVSSINPCIGYGDTCRKAEAFARKHNAAVLVDKNVKNAADMDVYLSRLKLVGASEACSIGTGKPAVLITKGNGSEKLKLTYIKARK